MKSQIILIASVLLALTSCGTTASFTQAAGQQKYQDGIYYRPQTITLEEQAARLSETEELISKTRSSAVFVKTIGKVDTLVIPDNLSATFKFDPKDNTTTISLYDGFELMDDWMWSHSAWYRYNSFWGPSWRFGSRYWGLYDPFWYDPFWYDPFWYSSVWDPFWSPSWYYGPFYGYGFYDPFWGPYRLGYYYPFYDGHYHNRYSHSIYDGIGGRGFATRSDSGTVRLQPRAGVGRVVRAAGGGSDLAGKSVSESSAPSRVSVAPRTESTALRSEGAAQVRRQTGVSAGSGASSYSAGTLSSGANRTGAASSATGAYRRSTTSSGSSGNASRASEPIMRGSGGSGYSRSSSGSQSYGSSSPRSSYSGGSSHSGGSSYSGVSRSAGGYSGGGSSGSASRGSGGGGRR